MNVLVDARNVLRSRWPNVPEDELVERCRAWAEEHGRRVLIVFDGRAPGGVVGERDVGGSTGLVGTGAERADDWIARAAAALHEAGEAYALVTSDRELRRRAGRAADRTTGGGSFLRELGLSRS